LKFTCNLSSFLFLGLKNFVNSELKGIDELKLINPTLEIFCENIFYDMELFNYKLVRK